MVYKVYCLTNPCIDGYCKVGYTTGLLEKRIKSLSNTSVILPFKLEYFIEDKINYEITIHNELEKNGFERIKGKEFFKCKPEDIKHIFQNYGIVKYNEEKIDEILNDTKAPIEIKSDIKIEDNIKPKKKTWIKSQCPFCSFESQKSNVLMHLKKQKKCNKEKTLDDYKFEYDRLLNGQVERPIIIKQKITCDYCFKEFHPGFIKAHRIRCFKKINKLNDTDSTNLNKKLDLVIEMFLEKKDIKII